MLEVGRDTLKNAYLMICEKSREMNAAANTLLTNLYCENGTGCGECSSCKKLQSGNHMDVRWVRPSGSSIRVDEVREMIAFCFERAYEGGLKTVVIEQAELLTEAAQNCLLKTMEEPPEQSVFLLLAKTRKSLLKTVVSRCEVVALKPMDTHRLEARLKEKLAVSTRRARLLARLSGGYEQEALGLYGENRFWEVREIALKTADQLLQAKGTPALSIAEQLLPHKEEFQDLLAVMIGYFYDILNYHITGQECFLNNVDCTPQIKEHARAFTRGALHNMIEIMLDTQMASGIPLNFRLMVENMLFHILEVRNDENYRSPLQAGG